MAHEEHIYIGHAEEQILGVTHAEVGSWLVEKWNLPRQLVDSVTYHHAPRRLKRNAELPSLIHLADYLCRREKIGDGGGDRRPPVDPAALRAFGMHEEPKAALRRVLSFGPALHAEMEKADAFTRIVQGDEPEEEAVVALNDDGDGGGGEAG
eukprot:GHVR01073305.1.p1 GENE.GHVR01073305.1~~GHVR01073305.1.p1  ORF type:complete len:152 (+),score=23.66 GHVR01073305.1:812-1267(+)